MTSIYRKASGIATILVAGFAASACRKVGAESNGALDPQKIGAIATEAYVFGYPLVTMDLTQRVMTMGRHMELAGSFGNFGGDSSGSSAVWRVYQIALSRFCTNSGKDVSNSARRSGRANGDDAGVHAGVCEAVAAVAMLAGSVAWGAGLGVVSAAVSRFASPPLTGRLPPRQSLLRVGKETLGVMRGPSLKRRSGKPCR